MRSTAIISALCLFVASVLALPASGTPSVALRDSGMKVCNTLVSQARADKKCTKWCNKHGLKHGECKCADGIEQCINFGWVC